MFDCLGAVELVNVLRCADVYLLARCLTIYAEFMLKNVLASISAWVPCQ